MTQSQIINHQHQHNFLDIYSQDRGIGQLTLARFSSTPLTHFRQDMTSDCLICQSNIVINPDVIHKKLLEEYPILGTFSKAIYIQAGKSNTTSLDLNSGVIHITTIQTTPTHASLNLIHEIIHAKQIIESLQARQSPYSDSRYKTEKSVILESLRFIKKYIPDITQAHLLNYLPIIKSTQQELSLYHSTDQKSFDDYDTEVIKNYIFQPFSNLLESIIYHQIISKSKTSSP
jgi:hypothetical protein